MYGLTSFNQELVIQDAIIKLLRCKSLYQLLLDTPAQWRLPCAVLLAWCNLAERCRTQGGQEQRGQQASVSFPVVKIGWWSDLNVEVRIETTFPCNSLSSVSDSGKDSNGTFPTWVNISASPCLSLLRCIYIPLASSWAITRRNKKVTITEPDLQTTFNPWFCTLYQRVEGKESEKVYLSDLFLGISSQIPQLLVQGFPGLHLEIVDYTTCFPQISLPSATGVTAQL